VTIPVWLLDVDGVLNACSKKPDRNVWPKDQWVAGRASDGRREWPILFSRPVADFIRQVHEQGRAEIRWHTTWQQDASAVGKLLDLPDFPVQDSPEWGEHISGGHIKRHDDTWWKIGAALRVVEEEKRPLVWTDDDCNAFSLPRATRERICAAMPTLIVCPSDTAGLSPKNLRVIDEFLKEHADV
jgi:hypothetical protein